MRPFVEAARAPAHVHHDRRRSRRRHERGIHGPSSVGLAFDFEVSFGQDISGRISGDSIAGTWDGWWGEVMSDGSEDVDVTAEYAGSRQ
jgi:hypothetical protein